MMLINFDANVSGMVAVTTTTTSTVYTAMAVTL